MSGPASLDTLRCKARIRIERRGFAMSEPTTPSYPPPPPPSYPPLPPSGESPNRKVMVILAYLWLLALIPFLVEKNDREVQWHAKNGLVLTAAEFIVWFAIWI